MEIKNTQGLSGPVQKVITQYVSDVLKIGRENIISVYAYGSVTGPDYDPKRSDVNICVVTQDMSIMRLKNMRDVIQRGMRHRIRVPLFLTEAYVRSSLDTFPMEFMGIKWTGVLLFGRDIFASIEAKKEDLRRECEFQLKGKLITIRQAYLEMGMDKRREEEIVDTALRSLFPVFDTVLKLKGSPARGKDNILSGIKNEFGAELLGCYRKKTHGDCSCSSGCGTPESLIDGFLEELTKLIEAVDKMVI